MHERDVEGATNWVAAQAASPAPTANGPGVRFDLDTASVPTALLREERYQVDAGLPLGQNPNAVDNPRMDLELARARRRFIEADGKSDCRRLGAGYRFTLAGHPIRALNDEYTVVELDATGTHPDNAKDASEVYRNRFRCIPSTYAPLPRRPKKRPKLGIEVAQVIAYSDIQEVPWLESSPNGYVKVRFRWDIVDDNGTSTGMLQNGASHPSGTEDDVAVWVPVVQPWAGAGYGAQFIPREGLSAGIVSFDVEGQSPTAVVARLKAKKIVASVSPYAFTCARLAPSLLTNPEEIDVTLREIRAMA
jgi:uncharacterized protein involved in type VI secretion and phage assembly